MTIDDKVINVFAPIVGLGRALEALADGGAGATRGMGADVDVDIELVIFFIYLF